jgi:putative effector of murein hydrolase
MTTCDAILLYRRTTLVRYFHSCISRNSVSDLLVLLAFRPFGKRFPCSSELIHASLDRRTTTPGALQGSRQYGGDARAVGFDQVLLCFNIAMVLWFSQIAPVKAQ